jgi:hypothetical protein
MEATKEAIVMRPDQIIRKPHSLGMHTSTEQQIATAWDRACVIDVDAAIMIAEQHDQQKISDEQAATALLSMVFAGDYMNTYSQLFS